MINTESYIVAINQLCFDVKVGIYEHELHKPQKLILNLEITVKNSDNYFETHIDYDNVFCYHSFVNKIEQYINAIKQIGLLENLARDIAIIAFEDKKVLKIKIDAQKPDAIKMTQSVGVSMVFSISNEGVQQCKN
ncbi:MAG: dihydroneopterin aldolase [Alphaproteobacteria bacterium]|nr:dihydroneopterin aldolase [Alphaproteobacteria bacterium]